MQIPEIDVHGAHARLRQGASDCLYLDVRSVVEYETGHAPGAWNLPILHATPTGMRPNAEFQQVATKVLPSGLTLLVGCKSGQRSFMACRMLIDMGFAQVVNVSGGFGGSIDPMTGQLLAMGWAMAGLPVTKDPTPGRTWDELRALALRES